MSRHVQGQLELLSQIVEEISGELALEPLLRRILERACSLLDADDGAIGLYSPQHNAIQTAATYGRPLQNAYSYVYPGQGLVGHVLKTGAPICIRYGDLPNPLDNEHPDKNVMGVPIHLHGKLVGVFCVAAWREGFLEDGNQALLRLIARHAAISIDNASRYSREQRRSFRFELIANVAALSASGTDLETLLQRVTDATHETLSYPSVDIALIDPDDENALVIRFRGGRSKQNRQEARLPITAGIMGACVRTRATQLVNDVLQDPRYVAPTETPTFGAELAIPIQYGDEVLGVLNVEGEGPFDELDSSSLEIVAEYLATAIINDRLHTRSRQVAVLEERQRLARDLHDSITQLMASMNLICQSLGEAWRRDPLEGRRLVGRLGELSQLAFGELRGMLAELKPDAAHNARAGELEDLPSELRRLLRAMVPTPVRLEFEVVDYRPQIARHEEAILRVCQEAVSNAVRHASARRIDMSIKLGETELHVSISDDGCGMPKNPTPGMGLRNMRGRLQELGGKLRITGRRPQGTSIIARLPRSDRAE